MQSTQSEECRPSYYENPVLALSAKGTTDYFPVPSPSTLTCSLDLLGEDLVSDRLSRN